MTRTYLLALYSILATVALVIMAQRVNTANRHARIAFKIAAAAASHRHNGIMSIDSELTVPLDAVDLWEN